MTLPYPVPPLPKLLPARPYRDDTDFVRPLTEDETQAYLEDTSDLQDSIDLWNKVSGVPGILDAKLRTEVQQQAYKPVETYFDVVNGVWRYVGSNYRVPASRVRWGVLRLSRYSEGQMRELTVRLVNGEISRQQWYDTMRKMMKDEYRASYLASIGGRANYTQSEISKFGWRMRPHYRWLNNFLDELYSGKQALNGRAVIRAGMYGRAGNVIYQNQLLRVAQENGMNEAKRVLGPTENHCHDTNNRPGCIELAAQGWVAIDLAVEIGDASCFSFCLCSFKFRK